MEDEVASVRNDADEERPILSVIIPVFNEEKTAEELLKRVRSTPYQVQVVVVDDGSTDGTPEILSSLASSGQIELIALPRNGGKGAAIRTGLGRVAGDVVIIQDADLEYDPADYPRLVEPILKGEETVVFGSRFADSNPDMTRWHRFGNQLVTRVFNLCFRTSLTDVETCYKAVSREALVGLELRSDRWGIDPEIAAKLLKRGYRIEEIPISYAGRAAGDGKKLRWIDGFEVIVAILRFRIFD